MTNRYRIENGVYCIDVKFNDVRQVFDSRDPAPFRERDLDESLAHYLIMSGEEIPIRSPIKVVMSCSKVTLEETIRQDVIAGLHNYFDHEGRKLRNDLVNLFRQGWWALSMGLCFLAVCTFAAAPLREATDFLLRTTREGLAIVGWVALWKPVNIFLYDWWPIQRKRRLFWKLAHAPVEFTIYS